MRQLLEPQSMTDLLMQYIESNKRIQRSTVNLTLKAFGRLIESVGDIRPAELTFGDCERFQQDILLAGCRPVTANIYVKTARPIVRWALRNGWISSDPFEHLRFFSVPAGEIRVYDRAEFERMLMACRSRIWQGRLLLAKTAAMRRGEILNLTLRDIDFDTGVITIRRKKETRDTWEWTTKSRKFRQVPLAEAVSKFLTDFVLRDMPEKQPYLMLTGDRYKRIQQLRNKGLLSDRIRRCPDENWAKPFERIRTRAGIDDGTFHDLRRTCITEWLESGLQPHEVKVLAGHASIETTMRYYVATRRALIDRARAASQKVIKPIGATGLEPATS